METGLHLLMRDGAARVVFQPRLSTEQYSELLDRVARAVTKSDLRREMKEAAKMWGKALVFDTEIE
jgi:hypothetical protein